MCDLNVDLDGGRTRASGRGRDLNEQAISCTVDQPIEPGTKVQVALRLVLEWGTSEALVLPAQVGWLTETEGAYQIGALFTPLGPDERQRLAVLIKVLRGQISLPARSAAAQ